MCGVVCDVFDVFVCALFFSVCDVFYVCVVYLCDVFDVCVV